jgi:hypothetical protein
MARLTEDITRHDARYYNDAAPLVSDAEYDRLRLRLEAGRDTVSLYVSLSVSHFITGTLRGNSQQTSGQVREERATRPWRRMRRVCRVTTPRGTPVPPQLPVATSARAPHGVPFRTSSRPGRRRLRVYTGCGTGTHLQNTLSN